ncbi:MAG: HigA family addiction module antidote protein [Candidatus Moeniiplasma glomeromycotorum]|nr:HigA family addiction module antidote protein [Candidatus Moeniiplasma glomeromycotorum]MCE8169466.1 HigA family addiction module antidote protein [Candidatus Moeniiplasma glomeromycotorum]
MANNLIREKDPDLKPIHPGEILREELLIPLKLSAEQLVAGTKIEEEVIKKILAGKQDITPEISYQLGLFFDLREDYFLDFQKHYELDCWKEQTEKAKIIKNQVLSPYLLTLRNSIDQVKKIHGK